MCNLTCRFLYFLTHCKTSFSRVTPLLSMVLSVHLENSSSFPSLHGSPRMALIKGENWAQDPGNALSSCSAENLPNILSTYLSYLNLNLILHFIVGYFVDLGQEPKGRQNTKTNLKTPQIYFIFRFPSK